MTIHIRESPPVVRVSEPVVPMRPGRLAAGDSGTRMIRDALASFCGLREEPADADPFDGAECFGGGGT